jgi:hypothetical protein
MSGIEGVRPGTGASKVLSVFGRPFAKVPASVHGQHQTCWAYHAFQPRTSIDALDVCLNEEQKVERIRLGEHGAGESRDCRGTSPCAES